MIEPNRLSAVDAARLIARRELSAETLARSCLDRIAARDADVRAWAWLDRELALGYARALDAAPASGALHGLPVGVKDIFDTHDMPTEYGSTIYAGHRPRADSAPVALTRRAGGLVLGKTVTTEFATFVPGRTRNPHDLARTPGGSSSGSAAAVADCMVPLAFGTQTAGSLIRPGSYCGVVAYKPSYNTLPRAGVKPNADSLDTVGVFARTVPDAAFFVSALAGRAHLRIERASLDRPRIGICRTYEWDRVQPEMARALELAARRLASAGAAVAKVALPARFKGLHAAHGAILRYEFARSLCDEFVRHRASLSAGLQERCSQGFALDAGEYVRACALAAECRAAVGTAFGDCDILLSPAAAGEAPAGLDSTGDPSLHVVWTLLHTPSVSIPCGAGPNGMPLGLQAIGRIGDDARTLACADWIHSRLAATSEER